MSATGSFFVRWRVRLGYPLAIVIVYLSRPTPGSILSGTLIGVFGLCIRAYAAGYLHKKEVLTVMGPYAYTRNPLYLGSAILALGAGIATRSLISVLLLIVYFALFYSIVMQREANELHIRHGASFDEYAHIVPLFIPRLTAAKLRVNSAGAFSFAQYKKNHEWQAAVGFLFLILVLFLRWHLSPR